MDAGRLIAALRSPAAYPHPVDRVDLVETHISWVLLAGERAYKIKKPVNFGFVDFSTLDRRHRFCEEEVRLNRRLSPDLYFGVVPVTDSPGGVAIGGTGRPVEFAVAMRRFPDDALLARVLDRGELTAAHVDQLAETIAAFHAGAAVASKDEPFGSPERVWQPAGENFEHVEPGIDDATVGQLRDWSEAEFRARRSDFAARKEGGFVRECHGDMHLGNMLLFDGRVAVFDGIEFNDDLRWIDVLSEVAFALMDLDDRGRPDLASRLLNGYLERTGDYAGASVLPFYLVYRAMVRAKVASIRSTQAGDERERHRAECRHHLALADRYARHRRPAVIITHGVSGSGKTTVSQSVLEAVGAIRVRSDVERKRLFGRDPLERGMGDALYESDATARTYGRLANWAEAIAKAGFPVVIDATFLARSLRNEFRALAERLGVPFAILDVRAEAESIRDRVARRARAGDDASDADLEVTEAQFRTREVLAEDELGFVIPVETGRPETVAEAVAAIDRVREGGRR